MLEKVKDRGTLYATVAATLCCVMVTAQEAFIIPESELLVATVGRMIPMLVFFYAGVRAAYRPDLERYSALFAIAMYVWSFQGEFYRPNYAYAIIQFQVVHALFFRMKLRNFFLIHGLMTCAFIGWMYYNWDVNSRRIADNPVFEDYLVILIISTVLSSLIYMNLNRRKKEREETLSHFALVGKQTAALLHDFKNLAASPKLYADALLARSDRVDPETLDLLRNLQGDLERMNRMVKELHQSTKQPVESAVAPVELRRAVQDAIEVMNMRTRGIDFRVEGRSKLLVNGRSLQTILLNLIYNSIENFQRRDTLGATLWIRLDDHSLVFEDNGGGLPADTLRGFNSGGQNLGDGMGLFLIRDTAQAMDIEIHAENSAAGARFTLRFS